MVSAQAVNTTEENSELKQILQARNAKWWQAAQLKLTMIIFLALITSMTNGYDGSMMNGLQTVDLWQDYFNHPTGSLLGVFNAIQSIGGIAGLVISAYLADRLGRRGAIFVGSILMLIGVAIQTAAQNIGMFIGARALIGFGLTQACTAAPLLITELAFPAYRGPLTSLYNSSWYLGSIVAAWTTFGTFRINNNWSWRIPSLLQGLPSVFQVALILFIPESPRWNIAHGKDEKALRFFQKYHCDNNPDDPLIDYEYQEIKTALQVESEANKGSSYLDLFRTRGNLRRMRVIIAIAFFSQWSGNGLVSYYLNKVLDSIGITSQGQQNLYNGILQIYNYGTAILGALVVDRVGRRPLFLTSTAGMTIAFSVWTACAGVYANSVKSNPDKPNTAAGRAVAGIIFIYYGFYNIAMSPLLVSYTVEIVPFKLRAKALVLMNLAVNCSLVFNQYANPIALDALEYKYYIVYCVWLAVEFVFCYFYIIETKGPSLEEIAVIFDGLEAQEEVKGRTHEAVAGHHAPSPSALESGEKSGSVEGQLEDVASKY